MSDQKFMRLAYAQACQGRDEDGIPIGCVLVKQGEVVGAGHNRRVQRSSAILHAEMDALEQTGRRPGRFYRDVTLYTTLSPCAMCSGAVLLYGIPRVVVGENQNFTGEEDWLISRGVAVEVLDDANCRALMTHFIRDRVALWAEDIGR